MKKEIALSVELLALIRWLSALAVLLSHVRHLFLADLKHVEEPSVLIKAIYFFTGFGDEAVVVFFVLSGYLVGGGAIKKWVETGFKPLDYCVARFSRIFIVLLPALVVGVFFDLLGGGWFDGSGLYTEAARFGTVVLKPSALDDVSLIIFLGNLFCLQEIFFPTMGSNSALWSLAYEWWYYVIFLAGAYFVCSKVWAERFVALLVVIGLLWMLPGKILLWGIIWGGGALVVLLRPRRFWKNEGAFIAGFFLVGCLVVLRLTHNVENLSDRTPMAIKFLREFILGLSVTAWIFSVVHLKKMTFEGGFCRVFDANRKFSDFSFSLYLFHFPFVTFVAALGSNFGKIRVAMQPSWAALLWVFGVSVAAVAWSYLWYCLAERKTPAVRECLKNYLQRVSARKGNCSAEGAKGD